MIDENRLPERLATDLDAHFEELVRTYQDRLYAFALRLTGSSPDAEECVQDALVRAYRALQGYPQQRRRELNVRPWLYRIVLNVVRNRARRPKLTLVPIDGPVGERLAASTRDQPEVTALRAETRHRLARAIVELPPRYATAVVLRHVQGLSYADAAAVLEQPVGTTKSDVHRGVRLLRDALEPDLQAEARSV